MSKNHCYVLGRGLKSGETEIGMVKVSEARRNQWPYWYDRYSANCALDLHKCGVLFMAPNYNLLKIEKRWWQEQINGRMCAKAQITDRLVKKLFGCKSIEEFLLRLDRQQIMLPRYADFGGEWATRVAIEVLTPAGTVPMLFIEEHSPGLSHALIWRSPTLEKRVFVVKGHECDDKWDMWIAPSATFVHLITGDDDLQLVEGTNKADPTWRDGIDKPGLI